MTVALGDEAPLGKLREGPVTATYVSEQRKNVLTVPVAALVALAEGGYGLETIDDSRRRHAPFPCRSRWIDRRRQGRGTRCRPGRGYDGGVTRVITRLAPTEALAR
ncbi:hypothetical protein [Paractinoplanes maris]|uniref:hypothetical protein n=1 Tax=Paractinoplanes maris TaxID=1734446 RepID=UPI002021EA20|nr:hypothetical protein [Actinoplanes maris]